MQGSSTSTLSSRPVPKFLLKLAPLHLVNHRKIRYVGDDSCVSIGQLDPRDQTLLCELYERLNDLLHRIADPKGDDPQKWNAVEDWIRRHDLDRCIDEVREIGLASGEQNPGENLSKSMHDVRGGALSALLGRLQLLSLCRKDPGGLNAIFVQTRDHLKIMRSAVIGLDDVRRDADRQPKAHLLAMMLEKWKTSVTGPQWEEHPIHLEIDCHHEGALTECCLESAAVDRIFYNLAANAGRHSTDNLLKMAVFPLPDPSEHCLRFVFSNKVGEADATRLRALTRTPGSDSVGLRIGQSMFPLFEPEVSSTGSGFGLTVVADFVAEAFGLADRKQALRERYTGAVLDGQTFYVWFHWPMANENLPMKLDAITTTRSKASASRKMAWWLHAKAMTQTDKDGLGPSLFF